MNWIALLAPGRPGQHTSHAAPSRSAFEQDYDRIIFSHPFRRLQDKTQVHPLPEHDFVHTRLTHSLEVSSVGRSLGRTVGEHIVQAHAELAKSYSAFDFGAIVAAASLAHDLGNPPFGHAGEEAISAFFTHHPAGKSFEQKVTAAAWHDLINFEGNAQGFRIINSNQYGLKLTLATLGAFTKYPCPSYFEHRNKANKSEKKYGFFQSEKEYFALVAEQTGLIEKQPGVWTRHPLAFLVEAADDICYSIIDIEDGCRMGLISYDDTVALLAEILKQDYKPEKLNKIASPNEKIGVLRALVIGKLVKDCASVFIDNEKEILAGTFDKALADAGHFHAELKEISRVSIEKIYRARHVVEIEAAGHEVLPGLMHEFTQAGMHAMEGLASRKYQNLLLLLPPEIREAITTPPCSCYNMLRMIIDFVSGLTDRHALSLYRKIKGIAA